MPKTKKRNKKSKPQGSQPDGYYIGAHELLGVADDYMTVACMLTAFTKDATTKRGLDRMGKALSFTSKVVSLLGGTI